MSPSCGLAAPSPASSTACSTAPAARSCSSLGVVMAAEVGVRRGEGWRRRLAANPSALRAGAAASVAAVGRPVHRPARQDRPVIYICAPPYRLVPLLPLRLELWLHRLLLWHRPQLLQVSLQLPHDESVAAQHLKLRVGDRTGPRLRLILLPPRSGLCRTLLVSVMPWNQNILVRGNGPPKRPRSRRGKRRRSKPRARCSRARAAAGTGLTASASHPSPVSRQLGTIFFAYGVPTPAAI